MDPLAITDALRTELTQLRFAAPVTHVYLPIAYARAPHEMYLRRYGMGLRKVLLLGMNPGPFGMAQTGVPFGDVEMVRGWLKIEAPVERPATEHPKRPVEGFACRRGEVSGARLWGWARDRWRTPEAFFSCFLVLNYCPLCFVEGSGRNRTPDKLPAGERQPLLEACDRALRRLVSYYQPKVVIGVGSFAETRAREALAHADVRIGRMPHPSPANPAANRGWAAAADAALRETGLD